MNPLVFECNVPPFYGEEGRWYKGFFTQRITTAGELTGTVEVFIQSTSETQHFQHCQLTKVKRVPIDKIPRSVKAHFSMI